MKKMYTCFEVTQNGKLKDLKWNRYETEEECFNNDIQWGFYFEIVVLTIYIPID